MSASHSPRQNPSSRNPSSRGASQASSPAADTVRQLEHRIAELEGRNTFQEDQIDSFQKALYDQSLVVEQLQKRLEHWVNTLRQGSGDEALPEHEKPPHY